MKKISVVWLADTIAAMRENGQIRDEGIEYLAERIGFNLSPESPTKFSNAFLTIVNADRKKYKK